MTSLEDISTPFQNRLMKFFAQFRKACLFLHLFFLLGCSNHEKTLEELFLENIMIRENGLYVLMGSKPMCCFEIEDGFSEPQERRLYEIYLYELQKSNSSAPAMTFEEFQKQHYLPIRLHYRKLWNKWKESMNSSVLPCYKFVQRKSPFDHSVDLGYFVNVPSMIFVLKEHYQSFVQITGGSFDPNHIVDEMTDNNSLFWEKALQSHYLMGLLYGFGERNSFFFDWGAKNNTFLHALKVPDQKKYYHLQTAKVSPSDLKLPLFGVYSLNDPTIETYKKERKYIQRELKGKNFTKFVLERLTKEPQFE